MQQRVTHSVAVEGGGAQMQQAAHLPCSSECREAGACRRGLQRRERAPGRGRHSNDYLLPTIITFLNDRDWQLRAAFFRHIPCLAATTGIAGLEAFLLPCVEQARGRWCWHPAGCTIPVCCRLTAWRPCRTALVDLF